MQFLLLHIDTKDDQIDLYTLVSWYIVTIWLTIIHNMFERNF